MISPVIQVENAWHQRAYILLINDVKTTKRKKMERKDTKILTMMQIEVILGAASFLHSSLYNDH